MISKSMIKSNMNVNAADCGTKAVETDTFPRFCAATFSSFSDAERFRKFCDLYWIPSHLISVPGVLHSSCPACVEFELQSSLPFSLNKLPVPVREVAEKLSDGSWLPAWHAKH